MEAAARGEGLFPVFQPIVSLADDLVVGFEALARWPGLPQDEVIERSKSLGSSASLDARCINSALEVALGSDDLAAGSVLTVNCEPASRAFDRADGALLARARENLQLAVEFTERDCLAHPHGLLNNVDWWRREGFLIALDDVGAHPDSLALLDLASPDIVKLDMAMVQCPADYERVRTVAAVLAHCERTGATILAEGIETDTHLHRAITVGATLGQGFRWGRPGVLDDHAVQARYVPGTRSTPSEVPTSSVFDLAEPLCSVRIGAKPTLTEMSAFIEVQAADQRHPPMILTTLQRPQYFTRDTRKRYRQLLDDAPLVAVFCRELPSNLDPGIRAVPLSAADPLREEWVVLTLGPYNAAAIIARERLDSDAPPNCDDDREFDYIITYDRSVVTAAARSLLQRVH